jgi:hypothetical protein
MPSLLRLANRSVRAHPRAVAATAALLFLIAFAQLIAVPFNCRGAKFSLTLSSHAISLSPPINSPSLPSMHPSRSVLPLVCAHGGDTAAAPRNTLAAIRAAREAGVSCIEFDVQLAADAAGDADDDDGDNTDGKSDDDTDGVGLFIMHDSSLAHMLAAAPSSSPSVSSASPSSKSTVPLSLFGAHGSRFSSMHTLQTVRRLDARFADGDNDRFGGGDDDNGVDGEFSSAKGSPMRVPLLTEAVHAFLQPFSDDAGSNDKAAPVVRNRVMIFDVKEPWQCRLTPNAEHISTSSSSLQTSLVSSSASSSSSRTSKTPSSTGFLASQRACDRRLRIMTTAMATQLWKPCFLPHSTNNHDDDDNDGDDGGSSGGGSGNGSESGGGVRCIVWAKHNRFLRFWRRAVTMRTAAWRSNGNRDGGGGGVDDGGVGGAGGDESGGGGALRKIDIGVVVLLQAARAPFRERRLHLGNNDGDGGSGDGDSDDGHHLSSLDVAAADDQFSSRWHAGVGDGSDAPGVVGVDYQVVCVGTRLLSATLGSSPLRRWGAFANDAAGSADNGSGGDIKYIGRDVADVVGDGVNGPQTCTSSAMPRVFVYTVDDAATATQTARLFDDAVQSDDVTNYNVDKTGDGGSECKRINVGIVTNVPRLILASKNR